MFRFCAGRYSTLCGGGPRGADKLLTALMNDVNSVNIEGFNALKPVVEAVFLTLFFKKRCLETSTGYCMGLDRVCSALWKSLNLIATIFQWMAVTMIWSNEQ